MTGLFASFRKRVANSDALPQLAILGLLSGLMAGAVIVLFRFLVEESQALFLPGGDLENYEGLPAWLRFTLPVVGAFIVGLIFHFSAKESRSVGVVHVLERMAYHQAVLPFKNAWLQFVGATISLISGHSVGREGPSVHLGAAAGSLMGQWMKLPNNCMRTLVACGTAGAIAASFNTPLAGVIFAMEVIMLEYTIIGFTPVLLAAVSATFLSHLVYGDEPAFIVPALEMVSFSELPNLLVLGVLIGGLAALFIHLLHFVTVRTVSMTIWLRMTIGGFFVGVCALFVPEVMGIGYDTVNDSLFGSLGIGLLAVILIMKLLATTVGLGFGLPGGLIGPTLVLGALAGALLGQLFALTGLSVDSEIGFYAMVGMGAMMGATLQAPLAALTALLELTLNPNIILPAMLAIVAADLTASHVFGKDSVFRIMLQARGLDYRNRPLAQALRGVGVATAMNRAFSLAAQAVPKSTLPYLLENQPLWIIVERGSGYSLILAADLDRYHRMNPDEQTIELLAIPASRMDALAIDELASLQDALELLDQHGSDAVVVVASQPTEEQMVQGVVTRQAIQSYYQ